MKIFERMSSYESIDVTTFCMVFPLKSKGMTSRWPLKDELGNMGKGFIEMMPIPVNSFQILFCKTAPKHNPIFLFLVVSE